MSLKQRAGVFLRSLLVALVGGGGSFERGTGAPRSQETAFSSVPSARGFLLARYPCNHVAQVSACDVDGLRARRFVSCPTTMQIQGYLAHKKTHAPRALQ